MQWKKNYFCYWKILGFFWESPRNWNHFIHLHKHHSLCMTQHWIRNGSMEKSGCQQVESSSCSSYIKVLLYVRLLLNYLRFVILSSSPLWGGGGVWRYELIVPLSLCPCSAWYYTDVAVFKTLLNKILMTERLCTFRTILSFCRIYLFVCLLKSTIHKKIFLKI